MTFDISHAEMVKQLTKPATDILAELSVDDCGLIHAAMGISGEAGEIIDAVKKAVIYRKPLDRENLREELGDLEFYLEDLRRRVGLTREECLQANMEKLNQRYPGFDYTNQRAIERADKT